MARTISEYEFKEREASIRELMDWYISFHLKDFLNSEAFEKEVYKRTYHMHREELSEEEDCVKDEIIFEALSDFVRSQR